MKRLILSMLPVALAACSTYQAPRATEPTATLAIDGEATLTAATNWWVYDNACQQQSERSGQLTITSNIGGRHKEAAIRAGEPVYLVVNTNRTTGVRPAYPGTVVEIGSCAFALHFTPQAGRVYDAKLAADQCGVALADRETAQPPQGTQAYRLRAATPGVCVEPGLAVALPRFDAPSGTVPGVDDPVPYLPEKGQERFRAFLKKPLPRAFAIAPNGYSVSVSGTAPEDKRYPADPRERALRMCKEYAGRECQLYMVDERIVFHRPEK